MKKATIAWVVILSVVDVLLAVFLISRLVINRNNAEETATPSSTTAVAGLLAVPTTAAAETSEPAAETSAPATETSEPATETSAPTEQTQPVALSRAEEILAGMTPYEKLCQLIILKPDTITGISPTRDAGDISRQAIEKYPVCGFSFAQENMSSREQTINMLAGFQSYAKLDMFFCLDEEGGTVWRVMKNAQMGTTYFDSMYTYKDQGTQTAFDNAKTIGADIAALGFNVDFAPVADVWTNPQNTVIGKRAYSDDAEQAAELVSAAVKGFQDSGVGCTLKHFPGHGDTLADSHESLPVVTQTVEELNELAFIPFRAGIAAGADFVMVAHILLKTVDEEYPSSLSHKVVTGLLRDELGFDGVVITDSLGMDALNRFPEPERCVLALQAGCDILLGVRGIDAVLARLQAATESGELTMKRIDESVLRILRCKLKLGIIE